MTAQHSRVLCNANSIPLIPELAEALGIREALLLQQIHYWIVHKERNPERHEKDMLGGFHWYYATFDELAEKYPFLGHANHIRRMVKSLCEKGALIKIKPFESNGNHISWYRLDDDVIQDIYSKVLNEHARKRGEKSSSKLTDAEEIARQAIENARAKSALADDVSNKMLDGESKMLAGNTEMLDPSNKMLDPINILRTDVNKMRGSYTKNTPKTTTETTSEITSKKEECAPAGADAFLPEDCSGDITEEKKTAPKKQRIPEDEFESLFAELWKTGWPGSGERPQAKTEYRRLLESIAKKGKMQGIEGQEKCSYQQAHQKIISAARDYHEFRRLLKEAQDSGIDVFCPGIKACHRWLKGEGWNNLERKPEEARREIDAARKKIQKRPSGPSHWRPGEVDMDGLAYAADFIRQQGWDKPGHERDNVSSQSLLADPNEVEAEFTIFEGE